LSEFLPQKKNPPEWGFLSLGLVGLFRDNSKTNETGSFESWRTNKDRLSADPFFTRIPANPTFLIPTPDNPTCSFS
jgi:hypothetical protein